MFLSSQSPLLLRFVALEPLCLVAMLHVLTCRQHVKLQREALQLLCYVIEQASKVPVAQVAYRVVVRSDASQIEADHQTAHSKHFKSS